jgi:hypothetical protein
MYLQAHQIPAYLVLDGVIGASAVGAEEPRGEVEEVVGHRVVPRGVALV